MSTVWVVENDLSTQRLLAFVLEQDGHGVESFADVSSVLTRLEVAVPDLVILDLGLEDHDGFEICRVLKQNPAYQDIAIIVVTGRTDLTERYRSLAIGVDDFLTKPVDNMELILRVRNRLRRQCAAPSLEEGPRWLKVGRLSLDTANHELRIDNKPIALTPSEFSILQMLMQQPDRAMGTEALLVEALGYPPGQGNPDILRTHIRNLRTKVEVDPARPQIVINVPRVGYRLGPFQARDSER